MSTANLLGLSAYVLAFALLESVIIFGFIFITSLSIPKRFLRSKFVPIGATVILVASIAAALVHLYDGWDIEALEFDLWAAMWILIGIALMVLSGYWVNRSNKLEDITRSAVERLSILAMVYLCADIVGLFVILFRNLIR